MIDDMQKVLDMIGPWVKISDSESENDSDDSDSDWEAWFYFNLFQKNTVRALLTTKVTIQKFIV